MNLSVSVEDAGIGSLTPGAVMMMVVGDGTLEAGPNGKLSIFGRAVKGKEQE